MSRQTADAAVGMMDAAYFTGRKELLDFFNDLLDLRLTKIEQTAPGAIACQLTELIFPGSIPMSRVNWEAKSDYEFVQNYKLLQSAFNKHHVQRHVDVDKLIRAKYQDNLEFCQWLKAFYDQSGTYREDYDAAAVRARGKGGKKYNEMFGKSGTSKGMAATRPRPAGGADTRVAPRPKPAAEPTRPSRPTRDRGIAEKAQTAPSESTVQDPELLKKIDELTSRVSELELAVLETEKERDFYFEKLRYVEVMLQIHQEKGTDDIPTEIFDKIFKILYATAEENVAVTEEGEVVSAMGENIAEGDLDVEDEGDLLES